MTENVAVRSEEDRVELIVKSIFHQLDAECRRTRHGRVGFFDFALDPDDFGRSVENM